MAVNLLTIKDIRTYLDQELGELYDQNEISSLSRIIIRTISVPGELHQFYDPRTRLSEEQSMRIVEITSELRTGKPFQYVTGETEFYNCIIKVTPAVLIPRPETEELVDLIIKENRNFSGEIIDFGTGSGCIAIALAKNIPLSKVTGADISEEALNIAETNARINNTEVNFEKNDILNYCPGNDHLAGIIVSNPPYVRNSEKSQMKGNVLDFEPAGALFVDDSDPLIYYRAILGIAKKRLDKSGKIYFEINEGLGMEMEELIDSFGYTGIRIIKDLNGRNRIATAIKNE